MNIITNILSISALSWMSPLPGIVYISCLGKLLNRKCKDESGNVYDIKTNEIIPYDKRTNFDKEISELGTMPWYFLFGPMAGPYVLRECVVTTYYAIVETYSRIRNGYN